MTEPATTVPAEAAELEPAPVPAQVPAAASSPLSSLRERRAQARARSRIDLVVPGYDPPVYVRYRAVLPDEVERITARHAKAKPQDRPLRINSTLLTWACLGVFEIDPETGVEVSVDPNNRDGDWPRFDEHLAGLLGIDSSKAEDVVLGLYVEPMHVLSVGDELSAWSLGRDQELRRTDQGE